MTTADTPDQLLDSYFGYLQGSAGESRDWTSFARLFLGEAHLRTVVMGPDGENLGDWTIPAFVDHARELYETNGISQIELERRVEAHGSAAHAWARFESRLGIDGASAVTSGTQSIQMIRLGGSWWIVGVNVQLDLQG